MRVTGTITIWKDEKGYGFITPAGGGEQVFVHFRGLERGLPRPKGGEQVSYETLADDRGRPRAAAVRYVGTAVGAELEPAASRAGTPVGCAVRVTSLRDEPAAAHQPDWRAAAGAAGIFLLCSVVLALAQVVPPLLPVVYVAVSALTLLVYSVDKARARAGAWRVSENTLHLLEMLGGWPGALVAQQAFRHKNRKAEYQAVFWLIGAAHIALWIWFLVEQPSWPAQP